jgi:arginine exporter protein ArgO
MDENKREKWYFKTGSLILSFLLVGPLMLPLVWVHPRFSRKSKLIISAVIIILTIILAILLVRAIRSLGSYYEFLLNENI